MLVAVASRSGVAIDEHFGHATRFLVYNLDHLQCAQLESRAVDHYCHGQRGDGGALARIMECIADCTAVFVARIGDGPRDKLAAIGIDAVSDYPWEEIEMSLMKWYGERALHGAPTNGSSW
ncbi:NifB/NifX family molybdenum-iron cluster-binding protein [Endothiovibrio diazotrophicus]